MLFALYDGAMLDAHFLCTMLSLLFVFYIAGEKRFECGLCAKRFMRSDHLSKHVLRHRLATDEPKYVVESNTYGN